jgi:hypothetical protein
MTAKEGPVTRKHFEAIARIIAGIEDPAQRVISCAQAVRELRQFNANFDQHKFELACGVETRN